MKKKIRIYIVDDEMMAITYFKSLVKEASPACEVVGEAFHGAMAFSQICKLMPDIVFIDISMPVMNGLQLSKKLLEVDKSIKIVLLTSYRDFDYVKKGMEIGVTSYMLKNELDKESLSGEIAKIAVDILVEKRKSHTYAEHNVRNFLTSRLEVADVDFIYSHQPMQRFVLLYMIRDRVISLDEEEQTDVAIDTMALEELDYDSGILCRNAITLSKNSWCGIYFIDASVSDSQSAMEKTANLVRAYFQEKQVSASFILTESTRKFMELPIHFRKASQLAEYVFVHGNETILTVKEVEAGIKPFADYNEILLGLIHTLDEQDKNASAFCMRQILQKGWMAYNRKDYIRFLQEIRGIIRRYSDKNKLSVQSIYEQHEFRKQQEIEQYFQNILTEIYKKLEGERDVQYSRMVGRCLEYIHKNFQKNISVKDVAGAVEISDGHLRKCFKTELNITVVDYLTAYRIRKAKKLMKSGECRISEVYEQVGFTSSQYFSYVFKKLEGITPGEYLKQCGE